jgi:hypothetical protein
MTVGLVRGPALARPLLRAALAVRAAPDRVTAGGVLVAGAPAPPGPGYVIGSTLPGDPAPAAPPLANHELERLAEFLRAARGEALVLTGAGLGTESGIPDYRSPNGAYSAGHRPMTHQASPAPSLAGQSKQKTCWKPTRPPNRPTNLALAAAASRRPPPASHALFRRPSPRRPLSPMPPTGAATGPGLTRAGADSPAVRRTRATRPSRGLNALAG